MNPITLSRLPSFSRFHSERLYREAHALAIETARNGTPEQRETLQTDFRAYLAAEEKRIEGERKRIAADNAAAFLAAPADTLAQLDAERGQYSDLGEILMHYGIASVRLKRDGKGSQVCKGTLAQGTISPFVAIVRIGSVERRIDMASRNDRHSKAGAESFAVASAARQIATPLHNA